VAAIKMNSKPFFSKTENNHASPDRAGQIIKIGGKHYEKNE
jgi:hypothetical protein